jgi:hypothetical protein
LGAVRVRQVNRDELIYIVAGALRDVPASIRKDLLDHSIARRDMARVLTATTIVDRALNRYEVLSAAPYTDQMGEGAFSKPIARMMGEHVESGPRYEVDPDA